MLIRKRFRKTDDKSGRRIRLICLIFAVLAASVQGACASPRFTFSGTSGIRILPGGEEGQEYPSAANENNDMSEAPAEVPALFVYVCGQVREPGVYALEEGSRVFEAVEAAGGMTEDGVPDGINMAAVLRDADVVYIASKRESAASADETAAGTAGNENRININTAAAAELTKLPGIGEKRASDIIAYRERHGAFRNTGDIMQIDGIGEALYEKIRDKICVSGF